MQTVRKMVVLGLVRGVPQNVGCNRATISKPLHISLYNLNHLRD